MTLAPTAAELEDEHSHDRQAGPGWVLLPGTHICRLIPDRARDIHEAVDVLSRTTNGYGERYWRRVCHRYAMYLGMLSGRDGVVADEQEAMDILRANCTGLTLQSARSNPLWSSVYNTETLEWWLVWDQQWGQVYKFSLPRG